MIPIEREEKIRAWDRLHFSKTPSLADQFIHELLSEIDALRADNDMLRSLHIEAVNQRTLRQKELHEMDREHFQIKAEIAKLNDRVRYLREVIKKVHDDEETGHWGPDSTLKAVLANALVKDDQTGTK